MKNNVVLAYGLLGLLVVACSSSSSGGGTQTNNGTDAGSVMNSDGGGTTPGTDGGTTPQDGGGGTTDGSTPKEGGGSNVTCMYTVSGAQTASGTCTFSVAFSAADSTVQAALDSPNHVVTFGASILNQTGFKTGMYTLTDAPEAGATFRPDMTSLWAMCNNNNCSDGLGNQVPNQGTFTLNITDTGPAATGGNFWQAAHGSLTVEMPADPNTTASGNVTLTVTF